MPSPASEQGGDLRPLEAVLDEGTRIFREIVLLCADQRLALAKNDTQALVLLNERAETLAARFRLLESAREGLFGRGAEAVTSPAVERARRRLSEAVAAAALAASESAELLARTSAATAAIHRVIDGAMSAGYLPDGTHRPTPRSAFLETRA